MKSFFNFNQKCGFSGILVQKYENAHFWQNCIFANNFGSNDDSNMVDGLLEAFWQDKFFSFNQKCGFSGILAPKYENTYFWQNCIFAYNFDSSDGSNVVDELLQAFWQYKFIKAVVSKFHSKMWIFLHFGLLNVYHRR